MKKNPTDHALRAQMLAKIGAYIRVNKNKDAIDWIDKLIVNLQVLRLNLIKGI